MKRFALLVLACLLVGFAPAPVQAQCIDCSFFDVFFVELGGDAQNWNVLTAGGGSGFSNGQWFPYPSETAQVDPFGNVNPVPGWLNQWFYDGRFRPERYKVVDLSFTYSLANPNFSGGTDIVINWATPLWSLNSDNAGTPPTGFNQNEFIGRSVLSRQTWLEGGDTGEYLFTGTFDLRQFGVPFNPEWISIDVTGYNIRLSSPTIPGSFIHYCIPEPATVGLAMVAISLMVCRRGW